MKTGYSKVILHKTVIPDQGVSWLETSICSAMMGFFEAQERRERDWRAWVESLDGLKVGRIRALHGTVEVEAA